jgi:hypothetical protein
LRSFAVCAASKKLSEAERSLIESPSPPPRGGEGAEGG